MVAFVAGYWTSDDAVALASLEAHLAIFVGDFGEEDVELVRQIAQVPHRKAVLLGNHDAWCASLHLQSMCALIQEFEYCIAWRMEQRIVHQGWRLIRGQHSMRCACRLNLTDKRKGAAGTPADSEENKVRQQLQILGDMHVGFRAMPLHDLGVRLLVIAIRIAICFFVPAVVCQFMCQLRIQNVSVKA